MNGFNNDEIDELEDSDDEIIYKVQLHVVSI